MGKIWKFCQEWEDLLLAHIPKKITKTPAFEEYQKEFLSDEATMRLVLKARQLGFSTIIGIEAVAQAILQDNCTILMVSASQDQANELLNKVKAPLYAFQKKLGLKIVEESKEHVKLENGSRIISLPNNYRTVQGYNADHVYLDEFSNFVDDENMIEAIFPSISHGGRITIISVARGRRGQFFRLWQAAEQKLNDYSIHKVPWWKCQLPQYRNIFIPKAKRSMDQIQFKQQYECEFMDEQNSYFPFEVIMPCVKDNVSGPKKGTDLRFGIDFGKKRSSTVISIVEYIDSKQKFVLREVKEFTQAPYHTQLSWIEAKIKSLDPVLVRVDEGHAGIRLVEEMQEKFGPLIHPVSFEHHKRNKMIEDLKILFESKGIEIPRNEELMTQLNSMEMDQRGPKVKYTKSRQQHDDYVWSLAMAAVPEAEPYVLHLASGESRDTMFTGGGRDGRMFQEAFDSRDNPFR